MSDINLISRYNFNVSSRGRRPNITIGNINSTLLLDNLGDQVTENQILVKRSNISYTKLAFQIKKNNTTLVDVILELRDKTVPPDERYWSTEIGGVSYVLRQAGTGVFQGKWVLLENNQIISYTSGTVETVPWSSGWELYNSYPEATSISCNRTDALVWGVIPLSDIVGDIEPGTGGGSINWETV